MSGHVITLLKTGDVRTDPPPCPEWHSPTWLGSDLLMPLLYTHTDYCPSHTDLCSLTSQPLLTSGLHPAALCLECCSLICLSDSYYLSVWARCCLLKIFLPWQPHLMIPFSIISFTVLLHSDIKCHVYLSSSFPCLALPHQIHGSRDPVFCVHCCIPLICP